MSNVIDKTEKINENQINCNKAKKKRELDGVLIFNKPQGITSNKALQKVRYLFKAKKAGHTGSLDPLASGVLPICFGEATKFSQFLLNSDKLYQVTAKLGVQTDTGDSDGNIIQTLPIPKLSVSKIKGILDTFKGKTLQVPSMYSAIKHNGKPLYKYAREGIEIQREGREINVYSLDWLNLSCFENIYNMEDPNNIQGSNTSNKNDEIVLKIHCSKGTYIRTLVEDMGKALGCGAHVIELKRLSVSSFTIDDAISFETLEKLSSSLDEYSKLTTTAVNELNEFNELDKQLLQVHVLAQNLPKVKLPKSSSYYISRGNPVLVSNAPTSGLVSLFDKDTDSFLGVGRVLSDGKIAPKRLLQNINV